MEGSRLAHEFDHLHRFLLERAGVRGVLVRLDEAWKEVAARADYPPALRELLRQALAASALLTGNIRFAGSLSIQLKSAGALRLLFAQCDAGRVRGLAQWSGELPAPLRLDALPAPLLAVTLEPAGGPRQQGLIPVEDGSFAELIERYFERSEQIPTRILLAANGERCAALMLQRVAQGGGHAHPVDEDAWNRVLHLTATTTTAELLDLPAQTLLRRLYHEEALRLLQVEPLAFGCSCSRERVSAVLRSLGADEAKAAVQADGRIEVICEFCNSRYHFDRVDIAQLFHPAGPVPPSPRMH